MPRLLYGWYDPAKGYFVSRDPPDSPVRRSVCWDTIEEVEGMLRRQRAEIMWFPPLKAQRLGKDA